MFKSIRQSMTWLHSWIGLCLGWFMFVIFLTGSLAYYKQELNLWAEPQLVSLSAEQNTAIRSAYSYLQENASDAEEWHIKISQPNQPENRLFWFNQDDFTQVSLNPKTAEELLLDNELAFGEFFYRFHFQLYGTPIIWTRLFISFIAFMLLLALISGIITHKRIFSDFFTLRWFKSQRSWLDVHNITAVIALPFFLTMTFTGLALLFYIYFPQGIQQLYPTSFNDYFKEIKQTPSLVIKSTEPAEMRSIDYFLQQTQQHWANEPISRVAVIAPNTSQAMIRFEQLHDRSISLMPARLEFNAVTGALLENSRNTSPLAHVNGGIYALHMATFAESWLKLAFFISGLLGCIMIASGVLLWRIKRQLQEKSQNDSLSHFFIDRFNLATFVGLPLAIVVSFYAVRLDSTMYVLKVDDFFGFPFIDSFLWVWLFSFVVSLLTPKFKLWTSQLILLAILSALFPLIDVIYLVQQQYIQSWSDYWLFFRIDIFFIFLAVFAFLMIKYIQPILKLNHQDKSIQQHGDN